MNYIQQSKVMPNQSNQFINSTHLKRHSSFTASCSCSWSTKAKFFMPTHLIQYKIDKLCKKILHADFYIYQELEQRTIKSQYYDKIVEYIISVSLYMSQQVLILLIHCNQLQYTFNKQMRKKELSQSSKEDELPTNIEKNVKTLKEENQQSKTKDKHKLSYAPNIDNVKHQDQKKVKAQIKDQLKDVKKEIKVQIRDKRQSFSRFKSLSNKKKIERVSFPPPAKEVPLKKRTLKDQESKIALEYETAAKLMIARMKGVFKKDVQAFTNGQLAYHKVKYLQILKEKLSNMYIRRQFAQHGGLRMIEKWLDKVVDKNDEEVEPSLALRTGIMKILRSMSLTADEIKKTKHLQYLIQRNRMSQSQQLRQLCRQVLKCWDFAVIDKAAHESNTN